ncbi:hypothetical protein EFR01_24070 [Sinorhizobium fredii]|nr:hypothetical protein EFR01_24070 [Sinorhizobium fredii]GLS07932.1 hypothetical protein GCM10007864_15600 [Sinorhizobium fredii]
MARREADFRRAQFLGAVQKGNEVGAVGLGKSEGDTEHDAIVAEIVNARRQEWQGAALRREGAEISGEALPDAIRIEVPAACGGTKAIEFRQDFHHSGDNPFGLQQRNGPFRARRATER